MSSPHCAFAWQPASRTGSVGATRATALPMAITFAVERRSSGIRRKVRWPRSTPRERALQRDPAYTLARAGLAMACADMYLRFAPAADVERWGERAETEARAALDLDSDLAEAHLARAAVARKREFDWNATVVASRRALALNPNLDQARFFVAAAY